MTGRVAESVAIWRSRHARTRGDHAYVVYLGMLVVLVAVVPVGRAIILAMSGPQAIALLASADAPAATVLAVTILWSSALLWGRVRGPALRPPFVTHALASSDLPRAVSFRAPFLCAASIVVAGAITLGALIGGSLLWSGRSTVIDAVLFTIAAACVGIVAAVAWLAGQALPRTAAILAPVLFAGGVAANALPAALPFTPWGWVALAYPTGAAPTALAPLLAVTLAVTAFAPMLLNRLSAATLATQSARWETATVHASGMDLASAASVYQATPTVGRHVRAIRPALPRPLAFLVRGAVGAARTPVRLGAAALALAASAALLTIVLAMAEPSWALSAVAGVIMFAGLGPLTDGIRHAASAAADLPLYGMSDARLLTYHALFPLLATILVVVSTGVIGAAVLGHIGPAVLGSAALGILALLTRVANALKGPMPPALLSPIPTPAGDLAAAVRLAWAMDGILLAGFAGASAALLFHAPLLLLATGLAIAAVIIRRWRQRG